MDDGSNSESISSESTVYTQRLSIVNSTSRLSHPVCGGLLGAERAEAHPIHPVGRAGDSGCDNPPGAGACSASFRSVTSNPRTIWV
jgi:hypothetical protein